MKRTGRSTIAVATAGIASLAGGVAAALALSAGATSDPATTVTAEQIPSDSAGKPPKPPPTLGEIPASVRATYGVFQTGQQNKDRPDATLSARLQTMGVNPEQLRLVTSSGDSAERFFAAPTSDGMVCLVDGSAAGGCSPLAGAREEGLVGVIECRGDPARSQVLLYGLVPDGVSEVAVKSPDGHTETVTVTSNGWSYLAPQGAAQRPTYVVWSSGSDSHRLPLGYSPDVDQRC